MVFVTVGTHEQPFDRLVRAVDELVATGRLSDSVFIQTGYSTYEPRHCEHAAWVPWPDMASHMSAADVVITHGGPSSFIEAARQGKVPVVVPRQAQFGEHVNDHQLDFVKAVDGRYPGVIIPVYDTTTLEQAISQARGASDGTMAFRSHNADFCNALRGKIEAL